MRRRLEFIEERAPSGASGLTPVYLKARHPPHWPSLDDCLVSRPRPHMLVIWEPLPTKAPAPPKARPHCCYIRTVIFYHFPHIVRPWAKLWKSGGRWRADKPGGFEEWDKVEFRLAWDDRVLFQGEEFDIGGGTVVWARRRWWMRRRAWLRRDDPPTEALLLGHFRGVTAGRGQTREVEQAAAALAVKLRNGKPYDDELERLQKALEGLT